MIQCTLYTVHCTLDRCQEVLHIAFILLISIHTLSCSIGLLTSTSNWFVSLATTFLQSSMEAMEVTSSVNGGLCPFSANTRLNSLAFSDEYGLLAVGTAHGVVLYDNIQSVIVLAKCTLNAQGTVTET